MNEHLQGIQWAHAVKQQARSLGFEACGIADALSPIDPEMRFDAWLQSGYHADMAWMARTRSIRLNPQAWLPGARSAVVVLRNYFRAFPAPAPDAARVARYAWGRDYHRALAKPMKRLAAFLNTLLPEAQSRTCVDAGPVLERAWAARAGLGWIGKNSLVLRRDMGSWFVLGVIFTTLSIASDAPIENHCGSCSACMDACPTGAIVSPGVVDSRRCISYHTIENRGDIPESVQEAMDAWVFGCDICQEVCPWNRKAQETDAPDFTPRENVWNLRVQDILDMEEDAFDRRYAGTAVRRAKYAGMRRNALIVRQNQRRIKESQDAE